MKSYQIKEIREKAGLTQMDLAVRLGVTPSTVSRWENGAHVPTSLARKAIAAWIAEIEWQNLSEKGGGEKCG